MKEKKQRILNLAHRIAIHVVVFLIMLYQRLISPMLPGKCRYMPTCSTYTIESVREWGVLRGVWLGVKRISRCHPCGGWGYDPSPKKTYPEESSET